MKKITARLTGLLVISILILSNIAFAELSDGELGDFNDETLDEDIFDDSINKDFRRDVSPVDKGELRQEMVRTSDMPIEKFNVKARAEPMRQNTESMPADGKYEFRERMEVRYDVGPSYEGFNKEEMLFGRLFKQIEGEMNEKDVMSQCSDPSKMADSIILRIKSKIGDISNVCRDMEKEDSECKEKSSQHCSTMGSPDTKYAIDELHKMEILSGSCPVNTDAIKKACILRMKENMGDKLQYIEENCKSQWETYGKQNREQCEKSQTNMICKQDEYVQNCLDRYGVREEDFQKRCPDAPAGGYQKPFCENGYIKEKNDANGCFTGYECITITATPQQKQCAMSNEEAERKANDCAATKGTPEKIYQDGCIIEVKCAAYQCPYTEEQAREKESACLASNGKPETVSDGNCIVEVKCHIGDAASGATATGNAVFNSYDDAKSQCHNEWQRQRQNCENMKNSCKGRDDFVNDCTQREKGFAESSAANIERQCEMDSKIQIKHMERQCAMMNAERQRCIDESAKRCGTMQGVANECREKVTEENFRNFIIREAEKRCKFVPYMEKKDFSKYERMGVVIAVLDTASEEDIAKLGSIVESLNKKYEEKGKIIFEGTMKPSNFGSLKSLSFVAGAKLNAPESSETSKQTKESIIAGLDPKKVVEKLLELRDSDVSGEYKYIIEDKANDILEASESIDDVQQSEESRGFGYKLKLFLGFAKDAEESEIKNLESSKQRLETSIKSLGRLAEEIPDDISKAILKEQVAELERQKEDIDGLIKQKEKKSKGLLRLFGLLG